MDNPFNPDPPIKAPHVKTKGKTKTNHTMIAALIARGFSVKYVAKKVKMSESRIYHLLCDKDSLVNAEIKRILTELFASADRHLINLYDKTLQKLDTMLSSSDEEKQFRAIDKIMKIYLSRSAKNAVTIQQYFGIQSQNEKDFIKNIDDLILKMRKERGLPDLPDNKDSSDPTPEASTYPSPENSIQGDSLQHAPSQGDSSQGALTQEQKEFLKQLS